MSETPELNYMELVERPQDLVRHSKAIADEFKKIVEEQKMFTDIAGKKHVHVDGWSMLGVLFGIFPTVEGVERINKGISFDVVKVSELKKGKRKDGGFYEYTKESWIPKDRVKKEEKVLQEAHKEEITYKAAVILRTLKGHELTRVESLCSNREDGKLDNEEYAINSMAQTRATGKAFRLAFGWVARQAGYDSTPFEEVENLYPDREVQSKPHASIEVMDSIRKTMLEVKTEEDYKKAISLVSKYDPDLNEEDKDEVRGWCMDAKKRITDAKSATQAESVTQETPQEPEPAKEPDEAPTPNTQQNV